MTKIRYSNENYCGKLDKYTKNNPYVLDPFIFNTL